MSNSYSLVLGPQDGAKVADVGGRIPDVIFVGPKWLGDGFAAWGCERSDRFPECYIAIQGKYYHEYKLTKVEEPHE
jgi:hypothetical protein